MCGQWMDGWMDPCERTQWWRSGPDKRTHGWWVGPGPRCCFVHWPLRSCGVDRGLAAQLGSKLNCLIGGLCGRQVAYLSRQAKERISCVSLVASFLLF